MRPTYILRVLAAVALAANLTACAANQSVAPTLASHAVHPHIQDVPQTPHG